MLLYIETHKKAVPRVDELDVVTNALQTIDFSVKDDRTNKVLSKVIDGKRKLYSIFFSLLFLMDFFFIFFYFTDS
jgi:hypothetical protein